MTCDDHRSWLLPNKFDDTNQQTNSWLARVVSGEGETLGQIREKQFYLADIKRHHLVLDAHAITGLLTWEAVRQAPEGGVWALTPSPRPAELLQQQLNDAGFTDVDIDFREFGAGAQDHRGGGGHASNGSSGELASSGTQPTAPAHIRMQVGLGGMDIRL